MKFRPLNILTVVSLLAVAISTAAYAQDIRIGNRLIPESSIEHPEDIGQRAHTFLEIYVGPPGGGEVGMDGGLGPGGGMTPAQMRSFYHLPATGGSQIIAIVDAYDNPYALNDFNTFSSYYGLPTEPSASVTASTNKVFQVIYGNGSQPAMDPTGGWEMEEALDIEWAHAMAPNAKILLVEAADTNYNNLFPAVDAATNYTDGNGLMVKEVSCSWGGSEFAEETGCDAYFSSTSVSYFVSAGDSGAPAHYPSASPYVVSAGGTTVLTDLFGDFLGERGWSDGGGGPSTFEPRPSYQAGVARIVGSWRGTPDLSYDADPYTGASVYNYFPPFSWGWIVVGGTSWSSPSLAGIANLAATDQSLFPAGSQALLTTIYTHGAPHGGIANFRDIVAGNNGYAATAGWDFVSGVGRCIGLAGLQPPNITSFNPSWASVGGAAFTLTVNGSGFMNGATVDWNGNALSTKFLSPNQLTASVPAADIARVGTASVTVVNPGGGTSNAVTFTILTPNPVPVLTSISPSSAVHKSEVAVLVCTGSSFVPGSRVVWKFGATTTTLGTTWLSGTRLIAVVTSALLMQPGTASVTVVNPAPGGGASAAQTFTIR